MTIFIFASFVIGIVAIMSFGYAVSRDEGTIYGDFKNAWADAYTFFAFPMITTLGPVFKSSIFMFLLGLLLNAMFYGLLAERLIYLVRQLIRNNTAMH